VGGTPVHRAMYTAAVARPAQHAVHHAAIIRKSKKEYRPSSTASNIKNIATIFRIKRNANFPHFYVTTVPQIIH
jgi:hypothetical protein